MAGEIADADSDSLIGEVLANRYQVEHRLGEGAMGTVYKARHVKVGRPFAIKVLHSRLLVDGKILQRFEREAELAGRLHHPNVIGVVDVGETNGMRYMVMDFAEGPDLATLLSEAPMTPQRVIHLCRQMLEGLFHAHEAGLIHRDFKPENVIIERDTHGAEVPRIVDFGIAILRDGGESSDGLGRLTTNGLVLGTPHYMAPEQAVADPIDHRIDLFALGIMIYEMLCGKLPFDGTGAEVARANLLLDPPVISERVPHLAVDPLLEAFARRLMEKKRDKRPATAKVARDLLDLIANDRLAAAAALGVPLDVARPSQPTQPVAPQRDTSHPGTFPPPMREQVATPPQAPPMQTAVAVGVGERSIATEPIDHTLQVRRSRMPMIAAAIGGVAVLAVAAVALLGGRGHDDPAPPPVVAPVVAVASEPKTPDKPPPTVTPPDATEVSQNQPVSGVIDPVHDPIVVPKPVHPKPRVTPKIVTEPKPAQQAPKVAPIVAPVGPVAPVAPVASIDAATLAAQYKSVGAELKRLTQTRGDGAATDLAARFSLIQISQAMSSQDKRDAAATILSALHKEIVARQSR